MTPFYDNINSGNNLSAVASNQKLGLIPGQGNHMDWSVSRIDSPVRVQRAPGFHVKSEENNLHLNSTVVDPKAVQQLVTVRNQPNNRT